MRSPARALTAPGALWLGLWLLVLMIPIGTSAQETGQSMDASNPISVPNLGTDLWRGVRGRTVLPGVSQVRGPETGVLINVSGENWRVFRSGKLIEYSRYALGGLIALLVALYLVRGRVRIEKGRSGVLIDRWSLWQRVLHWYVAILFIVLALSGLSLLLGRALLIPVLGQEAFSSFALVCKEVHNYVGPAFSLGVLVMIIALFLQNLPTWRDVTWFLKGGGMVPGQHPAAGRINAGEKLFVYWIMVTVGVVVCVSGFVLDFPNFEQTRTIMQDAHTYHSIASIVWIFFGIGHIYLGTLGVEGVFEGMWEGKVDENWAKQHHSLWYEQIKAGKH